MAGFLKVHDSDILEHQKEGYEFPKFSVLKYYDIYINSFFFKIEMQEIASYTVYLEELDYDALKREEINVLSSTEINIILYYKSKDATSGECYAYKTQVSEIEFKTLYRLKFVLNEEGGAKTYRSEAFCSVDPETTTIGDFNNDFNNDFF